MQPSDLALPSKFTSWRKGQLDTIIAIASSEKRFYLLSMPTGGGKSAVYMGLAKMLDARALVLTGTKGLQAQLTTDFKSMGLMEIKGQNNYQCIEGSTGTSHTSSYVTVDDGHCHVGVECPLRQNGCYYYDAVRKAASSQLVVTNYMYWMTMNAYSDPDALGTFDLLILDEAHDAPEQLSDFCSVRVDKDELKSLIDTDLPPIMGGQEVWSEWATHARTVAVLRLAAARQRLHEGGKYVRLVRRLTDLARRLQELSRAGLWQRGEPSYPAVYVPGQAVDWVAEWVYAPGSSYKAIGALFSPTWAHSYAEQFLFKSIPRVVLVSATLQKAAARYLGIANGDFDYAEAASTFNVQRRPLIFLPTTTVDRHWSVGQQRVWVNKIDAIIDKRLDRKGIIHTRSYERAKIILAASRHARIMVTHGSRDARDVIDRFKRAKAPSILVSPSVETGYDFPYDQCEYQIIAKVPFMDTRSAVVKARAKADKKYLNYMTALSIIQQYGRGMRAEDDSCETFIIDDHIEWFKSAAVKDGFFPRWFASAYRKAAGVPDPIAKQTKRA